MRLLREPLLHFLLIGAAIYLLYGAFAEPVSKDNDKTIVVSIGEIDWMKTTWQKRWNRLPTSKELDGLIQQYIKETVLYREALNMGLNQHDTVIRRRLAQKMEFLARDLVTLAPPSNEELLKYFNKHRQRYTEPVRYSFTQVFFDPDRRGEATLGDAEKVKASLIEQDDAIEDAGVLGDGIMLQPHYPDKDKIEIQKQFGSKFAESLVDLSPGQWHGPVVSGYGMHLVYISNITEPQQPVFAEMSERVTLDWNTEKGEELNNQFYTNLRNQYTIVIEQADDKVTAMREQKP